jgi:hypothetical protein
MLAIDAAQRSRPSRAWAVGSSVGQLTCRYDWIVRDERLTCVAGQNIRSSWTSSFEASSSR